MPSIMKLQARQVFDSRGTPTVEAEIWLKDGGYGHFITPSGASCGQKEALELRDGDPKKFQGRGVEKAIFSIDHEIRNAILNKNFSNQKELDFRLISLDGTENKSRLGANAILAVSGAFFHAVANGQNRQLFEAFGEKDKYLMPMPLVNIINGGAHANNNLDIQEYMIVPIGASCMKEALRFCAETFYALKSLLAAKNFSTAVGDEGGFAPKLNSNEAALDLLCEAMIKAGFRPGQDLAIALDVAASVFFDSGFYCLSGKKISSSELLCWYSELIKSYPICSIEDPFEENDTEAFAAITKELGKNLQIVGDDLFVTNERYIKEGIEHHYANAVLIKMNQIGTITETLNAISLTQSASMNAVISHRSGESEDTTIADLAVLSDAGQIKTGSMSRSERMAKYNRLLRIEDQLGPKAMFKTPDIFLKV